MAGMTPGPDTIPPEFRDNVQESLKLWYKDASQGSPLADLTLVQHYLRKGDNLRRATNQVLLQAIEALEIENPQSARILRLRFLDGMMVHQVAHSLNIAEPTVYNWQARAIDLLASILHGQEQQAREHRLRTQEQRLPPASYVHLVGIEDRLAELLERVRTPGPPWLLSIEGIGGLGKTSLADALLREVARRAFFPEIGWVSAQPQRLDLGGFIRLLDRPALTADALIAALAAQLLPDLPATVGPEQALAALEPHLRQQPHLVVVDNLETMADVDTLLPTLRRLANPTKFVLTSRQSLFAEADVYHYPVPELSMAHAFTLIRQEAQLRNLPALAAAGDAELLPVYQTVGGNPLALRLVVGQTHVHGLDAILGDLAAARGQTAANLYTFIYRWAWENLDENTRQAFLAMPLAPPSGANLAYLEQVSGLEPAALRQALDRLVSLNLVDSSGDLREKRYSIHNLTRTFLQEQVAGWQ